MIDLNKVRISLQDEKSNLSKMSKELIHIFYLRLLNPQESLKQIKDNWEKEFNFIYGDIKNNFSSNKKVKPQELANTYSINTENGEVDVFCLFYAIQTYFSLFIKLLTYKLLSGIKEDKVSFENYNFREFIVSILHGSYFENLGIENYCYTDWFCWIDECLDNEIESKIFNLLQELNKFDEINNLQEFISIHNNDNIKQMYEIIIPRQLRHALGEYYTPDWLALYTIENVIELSKKEVEEFNKTYLDPTCGSGTFLFKTIQRLRKSDIKLNKIIYSVRGFDVNPIAVLTAKTNYLISIIDLIKDKTVINLPVYNYDVINSPILKENKLLSVDINNVIYNIPLSILKDEHFKTFKKILIQSLKSNLNPEEFYNLLLEQKINLKNKAEVIEFYSKLLNSTNIKIRLIIAYLLINRLEAYKLDRVDIIIGNPPWVNWEYLPKEYREKSQHLWVEYGLFAMKGRDLSFSKEDISILITYLVIDKFLKDYGHLAFVIRQGIFKSAKNGIGFRRFQVGNDYYLKVKRVDDLSFIKPFENATNSTSVLFLQKNHKTEYPVPYYVWKKRNSVSKLTLRTYDELSDILTNVDIKEMIAFPSDKNDETSLWITIPEKTLSVITNVLGTNSYKARTGVFTGGANAVYWLEIKDKKTMVKY
uniref:BsrGI methyltransferase n=1 Tax=Geobacillus stearothermophilus TaxID=1422 RepID=Q1PGP6_GEOSE|nr:BsrGI methyltransferase [Geobacillus stearothermophilus]